MREPPQWNPIEQWPTKPGHYLVFDGRDHYVAYWAPGGSNKGPGQLYWTGFVFNRLQCSLTHWRELDDPPMPAPKAEPGVVYRRVHHPLMGTRHHVYIGLANGMLWWDGALMEFEPGEFVKVAP